MTESEYWIIGYWIFSTTLLDCDNIWYVYGYIDRFLFRLAC